MAYALYINWPECYNFASQTCSGHFKSFIISLTILRLRIGVQCYHIDQNNMELDTN